MSVNTNRSSLVVGQLPGDVAAWEYVVEAVDAGQALLDRAQADGLLHSTDDWRAVLDPSTLCMDRCQDCTLGQLFGEYSIGTMELNGLTLDDSDPESFFNSGSSGFGFSAAGRMLSEWWPELCDGPPTGLGIVSTQSAIARYYAMLNERWTQVIDAYWYARRPLVAPAPTATEQEAAQS